MTKLRFIKPWGPRKVGDTQATESATTVRWLVDVYKVARIEPDNPIATAPPVEPVTDVTGALTIPKYLRKPARDKMVRRASDK